MEVAVSVAKGTNWVPTAILTVIVIPTWLDRTLLVMTASVTGSAKVAAILRLPATIVLVALAVETTVNPPIVLMTAWTPASVCSAKKLPIAANTPGTAVPSLIPLTA
ncbi:hypothetical protein DVH05_006355 [Phytophthora capsici]|nr:hypothetical protein DVH05_006355 [Phytophthora capsici]